MGLLDSLTDMTNYTLERRMHAYEGEGEEKYFLKMK